MRDSAVPADVSEKRMLRVKCIHCLKGKLIRGKLMLHNGILLSVGPVKREEVWLKCGVAGCTRLNMHSKCNFLHLPNMDKAALQQFCKKHIRQVYFY